MNAWGKRATAKLPNSAPRQKTIVKFLLPFSGRKEKGGEKNHTDIVQDQLLAINLTAVSFLCGFVSSELLERRLS